MLLKGPDGTQLYREVKSIPLPTHFIITSQNEHPVETLKLIDFMVSSNEMQMTLRNGPEGSCWEINVDGTWRQFNPENGMSMNDYINNYGFGQIARFFMLEDFERQNIVNFREGERHKYVNTLMKYFPEETYVETFVDPDLKDESNLIESAIHDYVEQMMAKWILKGGIEEDWDDYINRLKAMEVERLLEIKQQFYDQYNNSN